MKTLTLTLLITSSLLVFGCDKKSNSVKARGGTPKAVGTPADAAATARAQSQNAMQGLGVSIDDIYWPDVNDSDQLTMNSKLTIKTPQAQVLPLTTTHSSSGSDSGGQVTVSQGLVLNILTRCVGEGCHAYYMLSSFEYNGTVRAQSIALSYDGDCNFYSDSLETNNFMRTLDEVASYYSRTGVREKNDCTDGTSHELSEDPWSDGEDSNGLAIH